MLAKTIPRKSGRLVGHFIGRKNSIPQNGFFWMACEDKTKLDVELIFKEIFEDAFSMEKAQRNQIDEATETQTNKEELLSGY